MIESAAFEKWNHKSANEYPYDFMVWQAACAWQRQQDASLLVLSSAAIRLIAGEMTASQMRAVKSILTHREQVILNQGKP